jgi:hypothetical protein
MLFATWDSFKILSSADGPIDSSLAAWIVNCFVESALAGQHRPFAVTSSAVSLLQQWTNELVAGSYSVTIMASGGWLPHTAKFHSQPATTLQSSVGLGS